MTPGSNSENSSKVSKWRKTSYTRRPEEEKYILKTYHFGVCVCVCVCVKQTNRRMGNREREREKMCWKKWIRKKYYIYIYIYSHSQTDCLVVSQLFRLARHTGRFKLESKPAQFYIWLSILSLSQQVTYVSSGITTHYVSAILDMSVGR